MLKKMEVSQTEKRTVSDVKDKVRVLIQLESSYPIDPALKKYLSRIAHNLAAVLEFSVAISPGNENGLAERLEKIEAATSKIWSDNI